MKIRQLGNAVLCTAIDVRPSERQRPLEAVLMAAVIAIGVVATHALV